MTERAGAADNGGAQPHRRHKPRRARGPGARNGAHPPVLYGALDLGTNNCRLLIAARNAKSFRVVDAYSRIVRLGEGLAHTGALSDDAMERAVFALSACAQKMQRRQVARMRCVATQACRGASNGDEFVARVREETGLPLEIIDPREESRLAALGCLNLIDRESSAVLVIDIGGGSTELTWIDVAALRALEARGKVRTPPIAAYASAPVGVVTLAERFPEREDRAAWYADMCAHVRDLLEEPRGAAALRGRFDSGGAHLIGTSGTVTSLAGVHLGLPRYDRSQVDGLWTPTAALLDVSSRLQSLSRDERAEEPCIGHDRADLVLAGCAILDTIAATWPAERLRVADRGLREGMLLSLMHGRRRRRGRNRKRKRAKRSVEADT